MKQTCKTFIVQACNAWGQTSVAFHTHYCVEQADVGKARGDYLGHRRPAYTFKGADVGRHICAMRDHSGWTCWSFIENPRIEESAA
ncbi:hypothetical protein [Chromobacterium sp. ASV23]|uniref:hypothetical protein n=1 Tax=Chromobacterium sp. ASV23 TaxID=2795110 RepID=UPI0018EDC3FD|nr:hypothetical protein [Chromobacterium sp. ASV23]